MRPNRFAAPSALFQSTLALRQRLHLIGSQIIFYGGALLAGIIAGGLSHSGLVGASVAGILALIVAAGLRTS